MNISDLGFKFTAYRVKPFSKIPNDLFLSIVYTFISVHRTYFMYTDQAVL